MMKWGRKKKPSSAASSSSTSSSHSHLISHVFPLSWLSKFKHTGDKPVSKMSKSSQKDSVNVKPGLQRMSNPRVSSPRESNYYKDEDEDGFWRLSFGDEDRKFVVPQPYWGNCKTDVKEVAVKKKSLKSNRAPKEVSVKEKETAKEEALQRTYRRIVEATEELHRELDEVNVYRKSVEKDLSEQELFQVMQMVGKAEERPPYSNSASHRCAVSRQIDGRGEAKPEWKQLKDAKIKEVLLKNEKQRKSFHISRELSKQATTKVRVRSPRTPSKTETCRIRAIEDMKKAKLKKKVKDVQQEEKTMALGSFAVVKRSNDPQQDFKDSMVEMIMEKRITRPEELEELLACYLTLNADEYHDLIIKVFRQVWCELE